MFGRIPVLISVAAILANSCAEHNSGVGQAEALKSLVHDHPWLVPSGIDAAEFYRPWRKSWSVNSGIDMTLFGPPDSMDRGHRIVLLQNQESDSPVGLVLPSNASTDYWQFEFDTIVGPIRDAARFDEELMTAAKRLGKADHKSDYRLFIFDLFGGLLRSDLVQARDSAIGLVMTTTPGLGNDDEDASWKRRASIWKALADTSYGSGNPMQPYAFFDRGAGRIFLFDPRDMYGLGVPTGRVRIFRTGMNVMPIDL